MTKGEQASAKPARNAAPIDQKKPKRAGAGEARLKDNPKNGAGTRNRAKSGGKAGARRGNLRSSGAKPSGTNVSEGGGTAAKGNRGSK